MSPSPSTYASHPSMDEVLALRKEAEAQVRKEDAMAEKLERLPEGFMTANIASFVLLLAMAVLMAVSTSFLLIWTATALLLYSYNFILLVIPTTTSERTKMKEYVDLKASAGQFKELARHLILKRRKLAIEVGLTVFLAGMVPLALSFYLILGPALAVTFYYGVFTTSLDTRIVLTLVVQVSVVLAFLAMMVFLQPQRQGISKAASTMRSRLVRARQQGRRALVLAIMLVVALATLGAIVSVGALLYPGGSAFAALGDLQLPPGITLLEFVALLFIQTFIMRHFQVYSSRRMASQLARIRVGIIRREVIRPIDAWVAQEQSGDHSHCLILRNLKGAYYSVVIYNIVEQNLWGRSPIYLVAPDIRRIHNEEILDYVQPLKKPTPAPLG
ncbi:MAG TPA: hypothetical protein VEH08_01690 [Methanomassiliicoccales archaeon]|nr:hypothetical protein [Methanomassiliicoccales archaeon]